MNLSIVEAELGEYGMIGRSGPMLHLYREIEVITSAEESLWAPVIIQGESGTGKELVAQALHRYGARSGRRFVAVNCPATPGPLIESELFGYTPGSFTGANPRGKKGICDLANGGTLFLDEVADMSPAMQVKLLRVLQEGKYRRIGEQTAKHDLDVRLVVASSKGLKQAVREGSFRGDLYHRISGFTLKVPALRERRSDIPLLADYFLEKASRDLRFSQDAKEALAAYDWPGNVRQLSVMTRSLAIRARASQREEIGEEEILQNFDDGEENYPEERLEGFLGNTMEVFFSQLRGRVIQGDFKRAKYLAHAATLYHALEKGGNVTRAAKRLGIQGPNFRRTAKVLARETQLGVNVINLWKKQREE